MISVQRPLRVAVSGAPGVGKTTLIRELSSRLAAEGSVAISTEVARTLAQRGVRINLDSELEDYLAFMAKHVERMHSLVGDIVLFDRTLLDVLAFMKLRPTSSSGLHDLAEELCQLQMQMVDVYFFVPPEFPPVEDNVRLVDSNEVRAIDTIIRELLSRFRPDFISLRGSIDERARNAQEGIDVLLRRHRAEET